MVISVELISFVLILIPGLISFIIIENLITQHKTEYKRAIIYVILLNFISFVVSYLFAYCCTIFDFLKDYSSDSLSTIVWSTSFIPFFMLWNIMSIILSFFIVYLISKNYIYKITTYLKISSKVSNGTVWSDFLGTERENHFIVVRDIKNKLIYYGRLTHYSIELATEVHLIDTDVYNENAVFLYKVKEIYLPFSEYMTIEFPNIEKKNKEKKNEE